MKGEDKFYGMLNEMRIYFEWIRNKERKEIMCDAYKLLTLIKHSAKKREKDEYERSRKRFKGQFCER